MTLKSLITSSLLIFCVSFFPFIARADIVNMFAKVECADHLNYLRIDVFNVNGDLSRKIVEKNGKTIRTQHHTVLFDDLIEIDKRYNQKKKDEFISTCELRKEAPLGEKPAYRTVTYTTIIEPHFFNSNREGECGGADSFTITIKNKDHVLVDHIPSWSNCGKRISSEIEDQTINTIMLIPHEGYVQFRGRYSSPIGPKIYRNLTRTFSVNSTTPITAEKLYFQQ